MTQPERNGPAERRWGKPHQPDRPVAVDFYDAELRAHNDRLRAAAHVRPGDRVLDIGCGAGQSTRDAARLAAPGRVLGIDISERMLERAHALTAAACLDNVTYQHGDAQVHPFTAAHYDLVISRFGSMFFADAITAFTNIAHAMRPDARLVLLVWQSRDRNEWASAIDSALSVSGRAPASAVLDPFSLGDRSATADILGRAGFHSIDFRDVQEPVFYGRDIAAALDNVCAFTSDALAGLSSADAARALDRLRDTLASHHNDDVGVTFDSRAWLVTAHRTRDDPTHHD